MTTTPDAPNWIGRTMVAADGDRIGEIRDLYLDDQSGQPEWLAVSTGWFGSRVSFVPVAEADVRGDEVVVPYAKEQVKEAPNAEADGHLSPDEEARLYRHYGLSEPGGTPRREGDVIADDRTDAGIGGPGRDVSGPTTDDAMTRSEEELRVGTAVQETGRVRLRKWVETEHVTQTVPVSREEVRVEREPITDQNVGRAMSGPELSSEEHEVVLHEEQPVVEKEVRPVERVRLDKDVVTEQQQVGADVRSERIEVEGEADAVDPDRPA